MRDLICPVCRARLTSLDRALKCPNGHSFDIAREGYVNLRLATGKTPKFLGDSREMLQARREFLEQGHYDRLSDALNVQVQQVLSDFPAPVVVDAGCGEGYFLQRLKLSLDDQLPNTLYYGVDVAKEAAKLAAKHSKDITFVVADITRRLPFADASVRVLLNMFAPRNAEEFARILHPRGLLVVVIPDPQHLIELRQKLNLLNIEESKVDKVVSLFSENFHLVTSHSITYPLPLSRGDILRLVQMTPNYRHQSPETLSRIDQVTLWDTTAAFTLLTFQKPGA